MNKAFNKVSYSALICSFLTFIFLFSFNFVSSLKVSQWDKGNPSGDQDLSTYVQGNMSSETLGAKGLMPWVSSTNFISTDFSLQWIGNTLKNPWFTSTELGNSTNRFNVFAWNLTADKYFSSDGSQGWTGNCVNASYKDGIVVGCND